MPRAFVTNVGAVEAPGAAITPVVAGADSSFIVQNFALAANAYLLGAWRKSTAAGVLRIRSTKLANNVQGMHWAAAAGVADDLLDKAVLQSPIPQDTLMVEESGTATAATYDLVGINVYYDDLPGSQPRLHMPGDITGITNYVVPYTVPCAASATEGNWGDTSIIAGYNELEPNTDYAVMGYICDAAVGAVALYGQNPTSGLRMGGPGLSDSFETRNYFADLSLKIGKPCVPVFNSANPGAVNVSVADDVASTSVNVTLILAQLASLVTP